MNTGTKKLLIGAAIVGGTIYAANEFDLLDKVENTYLGAKNGVIDIFTTDLAEASAVYRTKLKEETDKVKQVNEIAQTMKEENSYLSNAQKITFVEYSLSDLPDTLRLGVAMNVTDNLSEQLQTYFVKNIQDKGSAELQLNTGTYGLRKGIGSEADNLYNSIKSGFSKIGDFVSGSYKTIESKIDSTF
jgi:hypothetical protein